jgi:DNA-binding CsgD family transcriptional regulator
LDAVATLSTTDAERILGFVAEAGALGGDQLFTPELLGELGTLIDADAIAYNELDRVRRRNLFYVERAPDEEDDVEYDPDVFWEIVIEEDPICLAYQLGRFDALKLSDFFSPRELRAQRIYDLWYAPYGVEYELDVAIPSPQWHTKVLMLTRHRGSRDFTERDRLVLDLLRPHLANLWRAAQTRRQLRVALAELAQVNEDHSRGIVLANASGDVEFASPPARRLLRDFFGECGGRLPRDVIHWLDAGAEPLVRRSADRRLTIDRSDGALLLVERRIEADLTKRESEVLAWVARGKTNAQIAELLWVSPSTVRKHLENVYAKLGVNTRTAAAARFLGLLEAEAS